MAKKRKATKKKHAKRRSSPASGRRTTRRKTTRRKKTTRRPRRNPQDVIIGDQALELRYLGGEGKRRGDMKGPWGHKFEEEDIQVIGKRDGSVLLKSKSGRPLWDVFEV